MSKRPSGWAAYNQKQAAARRAAKAVGRLSRGALTAALLCLLIGLLLGAVGAWYLTKNDGFALQGASSITLTADEAATYLYREEGFTATAFGQDVSSTVSVTTNLCRNSDGTYSLPASPEGSYYIAYTVENAALGRVERVRIFTIIDESEGN